MSRVLVFSQYFSPEITAAAPRVHSYAAGLAARGHEVHVICEAPSHPEGVFHPGYGRRLLDRRELDGFRVSYVRVITSPTKTLASRFGLYGSYVAAAAATGLMSPSPDVIFASSPPLPVGLVAALCARRHRRPWVLDVRDLWPEAAVAMGELTNRRVVGVIDRLARGLYSDADAITTVTTPFAESIRAKVSEPEKVHLLPNGTTQRWLKAGEVEVERADMGLPEEDFLWTYAGNLSAAQGLESAVAAAALLGRGYRLLIVGEGPDRQELERRAEALPSASVTIRGLVAPAKAAEILRASDALLVPLAARPVLRDFVPSKLFDCCAVGRPVIVAAAGEPTRLAEEAGAALCVSPGDPEALAAAVRRLKHDPELGERLAARGRAFAEANVRERQVERLEDLLERLTRTRALSRH